MLKPNHGPAQTFVLVVGAGPTGLTLACDLARRGINFRIIDKSPVHFAGSRGKGLQPRTLELITINSRAKLPGSTRSTF